jgi:hypothetical protein
MDVRSHEEHEEILALLKLLALGTHENEQGHFRSADETGVPWPVRSALANIAKAQGPRHNINACRPVLKASISKGASREADACFPNFFVALRYMFS